MNALVTERLMLRPMTAADAPLMLALLNDPDFLRFVGDRQVRTVDEARRYVEKGPLASYARHGYGPYTVVLKPGADAVGICGLFKRDHLPDPDIGFAFLPAWRGSGLAGEAARAVLADAKARLGITRVLAIVDPGNARSIALLERLGLHDVGTLSSDDGVALACYAIEYPSAQAALPAVVGTRQGIEGRRE